MKKESLARIGQILFWVLWPAIALGMLLTRRSRLVVYAEGDVLLVRGWLSSGKLFLPGGGLHWKEDAKVGAGRELLEEAGIAVEVNDITYVGSGWAVETGHLYRYDLMCANLPKKLPVTISSSEVIEAVWLSRKQALSSSRLSKTTKALISKTP